MLPQLVALANGEKEALGFIPEAAYREAIERRRLIAMCTPVAGSAIVAGFVLFSGVFPNARVQQIAVAAEHRRRGIASALVNQTVSQLESLGYLTLTAAVASDLPAAQSFYEQNGFVARRSRQGGETRGRTIVLRARDLETRSLLSVMESGGAAAQGAIDLGLRKRGASPAPLYAIDLNVLFDVTKGNKRPRSPEARRLISAALAHQIRLAVAPEFVVELERHTLDEEADPILQLARQLPRLPIVDRTETDRLSDLIHKIIFVEGGLSSAGKLNALSDARHLAQAALARASGYVTSDGAMLGARQMLLQQIGIDVASLEEFVALLPVEQGFVHQTALKGTECAVRSVDIATARAYLEQQQVTPSLRSEFAPNPPHPGSWKAHAVLEAGEVVAVGLCVAPANVDSPVRSLVHVRSDHVACETFADYLLDYECQEASHSGPMTIELPSIAGQNVVRRAAILRGFLPASDGETLIKVALGRPLTTTAWAGVARQTRRRTGLRLPESAPRAEAIQSGLAVHGPDGRSVMVRLSALEDALGPTIVLWPGRDGAIVPIAKKYADDLLGTGDQFPLFGSPEAAFVAKRTYFNSPRTAGLMLPGTPILFYESRRSGGRGAIVAVARIVDATVVPKTQVSDGLLRRAVVEDLGPLSASADILATSFDNLLRLPVAVSLERLRQMGIDISSNFQTTTALPGEQLGQILELGWARD
jgi:ribosomal protein S18 acetylase RimI-like enzyme/predicted nucleic acid-binding protein